MLARLVGLLAVLVLPFAAAAEEQPGYVISDHLVVTMGKETSGHVGACLMKRKDVPILGFGLVQDAKTGGRYTFFLVFAHDATKPATNGGIAGEVNSDGKSSKTVSTFDLGEQEFAITVQRKLDDATGAILAETVLIGDQELKKEGPRVFLIDTRGDKLTITPLKTPLPKTTPNLADREQKTWDKALDKALAEVKEASAELRKALE